MGLMQRSFYGGILILVILMARALLRNKLPRRTFPVLWGIAMVRLLLPFSFSSIFSVYSFLQKETDVFSNAVPGVQGGVVPAGGLPVLNGIQDFASGKGIATFQHFSLSGVLVHLCVLCFSQHRIFTA